MDLHHGKGMWAKGLELAIVCPVSGLIVCPELFAATPVAITNRPSDRLS